MCLFCKIIAKEIPAKLLFEDDDLLVFSDIHPVAPTHALVIPKKHIVSLNEATPGDAVLLGKLLLGAQRVAREAKLETSGWRAVIAEDFTVADILMTHVLDAGTRQEMLKPYPNLLAYRARCTERPAWKKTVDAYRERVEAA